MDWSNMLRPSIDNLLRLGHRAIRSFTTRYLPSHHAVSSSLFPIGAPRARMCAPSWIHASCSMTPFGARSLSRLSFPSSMPSRLLSFSAIAVPPVQTLIISLAGASSPGLHISVESSAYCEITCFTESIVTPFRRASRTNIRVSGSVMSRKRRARGLTGSPCATPDPNGNLGPRYPLMYNCRIGGWALEYVSSM